MAKSNCSFLFIILVLLSCRPENKVITDDNQSISMKTYPSIGQIIVNDSAIENYIDPNTPIEIVADGFDWSEGPLWVEKGQFLLFSDIPPNAIYKWSEAEGLSLYLKPSGYTGSKERGGEPGSNGLLLNQNGQLVMCQHGDRRMALMDAPLDDPAANFVTLADNYKGSRFDSPNDAVYHSSGDLYFTDPPYGLVGNVNDPEKDQEYQGVYRLDAQGQVHLLTTEISRPNGIAFSPDESILYVSSSDPEMPIIMAYDHEADGSITNGRIFFDAKHLMNGSNKGLPDGLKVHSSGALFATGPGGVLILSDKGQHLGTIQSGEATSNCALDDKETYLYATSDMYLIRVKLKE